MKTLSLLKHLHWGRERESERERDLLCFGVEGAFPGEGIWYWLAGTTEYSFDDPSTGCASEPIGIPITGFGIEFFILKKWFKKTHFFCLSSATTSLSEIKQEIAYSGWSKLVSQKMYLKALVMVEDSNFLLHAWVLYGSSNINGTDTDS